MNIGLIQLRFDILTVIIVCFVLIEVSLIIYSAYFREAEHSEAPVSVFPIRISSVFLSLYVCVCSEYVCLQNLSHSQGQITYKIHAILSQEFQIMVDFLFFWFFWLKICIAQCFATHHINMFY